MLRVLDFEFPNSSFKFEYRIRVSNSSFDFEFLFTISSILKYWPFGLVLSLCTGPLDQFDLELLSIWASFVIMYWPFGTILDLNYWASTYGQNWNGQTSGQNWPKGQLI